MAGAPNDSNSNGKREIDPKAKEHWMRGNSLFDESKFDDAIAEYTEAINIDKEYSSAYFNRALNYVIQKDFDSARRDLQVVMELEPKSPDAPLLMGDISEQSNDLLSARFWYERAVTNDPNYTEGKNRLEHIDSLLHIDAKEVATETKTQMDLNAQKPASPSISMPQKSTKAQQNKDETVIQDGQIKKMSFYKSTIKFDMVIGLNKVKKYMNDNIVLALKKPELFKKYGKKLGTGTLLYGPPGVGKTYIINAVAGEAGANVIIARINQIVDMYTGNTEKNLHAIFEQARDNAPCIIIFDEVDALGVKRSGGGEGGESSAMRLAVNQFLVEMNGIESNPEGIFVMGTTNQPWDIDAALKRSGRFSDAIYLSPPRYKDRKMLFELYTRNKPRHHLSYGRLSRATAGYSPADIEKICDKAAMRPLLHEHTRNKERKLNMKDMMSILKDKDVSGSSLDEWYAMVKKDVISKTETQIVDGKKQEIVKEGKLDPQEKILYKTMINDIKKNTNSTRILIKRFVRWWARHIF